MMNIDNERRNELEYRAYEMKKLIRILNNKVRSQKFTNKFIAYNAGMNEDALLNHMKSKPIKHESYVKFFNSIIELISNHKGVNKDEVECDIMNDIEKDPLISVNRISQIIEWDKIKEDNKKLVLPFKEECKKVAITKTKEQMISDIVYELADLIDVNHTDTDKLNSINKALSNIVNKFDEPALTYIKCLEIRDAIISMKGNKFNSSRGMSNFLKEINNDLNMNTLQYFYPAALPKLILDKSLLDRIVDTYINYMNVTFNLSKEKSLQLLNDIGIKNKEKYSKYTKFKFMGRLIKPRHTANYNHVLIKKHAQKNIFNLDSVTPATVDKFSEVMFDVVRPYHERYLGYKLNEGEDKCSINAWIVIKALQNIYTKVDIKYNSAYGYSDDSVLNKLNNLAKKTIRRDIYAKTAWSLRSRVKMLILYINKMYGLDSDTCFGIIIEEIKKEAKLFNEDIGKRLDLNQLKHFDQVIKYLFDLEENEVLTGYRKMTAILSKIVRDYLTLVYNATPSKLIDVEPEIKYAVSNKKYHPIKYIMGARALPFDMYAGSFIEEGLAPQISHMLDAKRDDKNRAKVISDEIKAFIVYQVIHFPDEYGIKPIELKEAEDIDVCNFSSMEEAEDYIESLFDKNETVDDAPEDTVEENEHMEETQEASEAITEETQNDNTNINEESGENMMRGFMEDYDEREFDGRDRDDDYDRGRDRRRGERSRSVGFKDLYIALQVIDEFMKNPNVGLNDKEDVASLVESFIRKR